MLPIEKRGHAPPIKNLLNGIPIIDKFSNHGITFNVQDQLKNPEEFYGNPNVNHLIDFKDAFNQLIGPNSLIGWSENPRELASKGIFVLEYWKGPNNDRAQSILNEISELATELVSDNTKYEDIKIAKEYFGLTKKGYGILNHYSRPFCLESDNLIPVSLERGGLVCTRLLRSIGKDQKIGSENRVVTKRVHLKNSPDSHLAVTVKWRDPEKVKQINGKEIEINDFVNPASGASALAFILAVNNEFGIKPKKIVFKSILATRQGIIFSKKVLEEMGIEAVFLTLGESDMMNDHYYLTGHNKNGDLRIVGDAGHVLRHFLPVWYKQ